jgi:hypothetical protein
MHAVQKCLTSAYPFVISRQCKFVDVPRNESMTEAELVREARQGGEKGLSCDLPTGIGPPYFNLRGV